MARSPLAFLVLLVGVAATSLLAHAGDGKPSPELPKPPTTPEPAYENPLADAKVGETLFYATRDLEGKWTRYFEERVLALSKDKALIETIETDPTDTKNFGVDNSPTNTGWKLRAEKLQGSDLQKWVNDRAKHEILYIGEPPTKAIRAVHRYLDEPKDFTRPDGPRQTREIWFSHDLPATGRAKMYPAQRGGERMIISWDKVLPAEECAKRAAKYPEPEAPKPAGGGEPGMGDPAPGMDEPGMGEPGMGEPGMDAPTPGMDEPGMDEPKGEPGMDATPPTKILSR